MSSAGQVLEGLWSPSLYLNIYDLYVYIFMYVCEYIHTSTYVNICTYINLYIDHDIYIASIMSGYVMLCDIHIS